MSEDQKYLELLKEIARVIKEKNDEIILYGFRVSDLQKRLAAAEKQIEESRKEN